MVRLNCLNNSLFKIYISILLFSLNFDSILADEPIICEGKNCGQGRCVASSSSILGYDCVCNEGWKEIQVDPLPSSCMIPNCSLDFTCGGGTPPSFADIPVLNFTSPCNFVWCNNGECVVNGTKHYCQCQDTNENLFDNPEFACFPQCAFGANCKNVGLGPATPPPPAKSGENPQSPPSNSGSHNTGSNYGANYMREIRVFTVILLSIILHDWL